MATREAPDESARPVPRSPGYGTSVTCHSPEMRQDR